MIGGLADTLKRCTTTDRQRRRASTRKAFADQKLLLNGVADTVRVLREKADDTNVRLSTMTQEMQSLRQTDGVDAVAAVAADAPAARDAAPGVGCRRGRQPPGGATTRRREHLPAPACTTSRTPTTAAGQYDLAIEGFQAFIRTFPTSPNADDAQLYIGYSLYNAGKNAEALAALQKVITDYPQSDSVSGVLQDGTDLRSAQAARQRAQGVRDGGEEVPHSSDAVSPSRRWSG